MSFFLPVRQDTEPCPGATEREGERKQGELGLSFFKMERNWKQPPAKVRVKNNRILAKRASLSSSMNSCQTIYTVSRSTGESLMHLQSIYEDFCFEDSFLGNRVKTCMDELSFISALASCRKLNSKNLDILS